MRSLKNKKLPLLLLCLATYSNLHASNSLCTKNEATIFSCIMKNKKVLSLCSNPSNREFIQYKYGKPEAIELAYPQKTNPAAQAFQYNHYSRYQTDYFRVAFKINNFKYEILRRYEESASPKIEAGISVTNLTSNKTYINECQHIQQDDIHTLSEMLPCDSDNSLGCDSKSP